MLTFNPGQWPYTGSIAGSPKILKVSRTSGGRIVRTACSYYGDDTSGPNPDDYIWGYVCRLFNDGTVDRDFVPSSHPTSDPLIGLQAANFLVEDGDGNLYFGSGWWLWTDGTDFSRWGMLRLASNGALDTGFAELDFGETGGVSCAIILDSGKLIVGGNFGSINGETYNGLARLNDDGTVDTTFPNLVVSGDGGASVNQISILPGDGTRMVVAGNFVEIGGKSRYNIAILTTDGVVLGPA